MFVHLTVDRTTLNVPDKSSQMVAGSMMFAFTNRAWLSMDKVVQQLVHPFVTRKKSSVLTALTLRAVHSLDLAYLKVTNYLDKWTTHIYSLNGRWLWGCTMSSSMWTRRNKVSKRIFGQWLSTSGQVLVHDWTEHVHDLSTSVSTRHSSLWGRWQWPISVLWRHVQWLLSNT